MAVERTSLGTSTQRDEQLSDDAMKHKLTVKQTYFNVVVVVRLADTFFQ